MGGLMGGLYRLSEWIMRMAGANLLWFICSLPVFLLLFLFMFGTSQETLDQLSVMLENPQQYLLSFSVPMLLYGTVGSIFLFPATSALFSVARKWTIGEEDVSVFKTFFKSYKTNFKQALLGGIIYSFIYMLVAINILFYRDISTFISTVFLIFLVLVMVSTFHYFSILAHLHMKTFGMVKNAFLITLGKPFTSLLMIISITVVVWISIKFSFLIFFFMGSVIAVLSFWYFHRIFSTIQMNRQEDELAEEQPAALQGEETSNEQNDKDKQ
ncbi:YesL family protein [Marinicrinis sediminis]|uniref:YesL family protein n=1 Tax=Marinicrinis sediminis TaxID=1652465 RepID=A0ABW5RAL4_9BACL